MLRALGLSLNIPSFDLANMQKVSSTDFFTVELDLLSWKVIFWHQEENREKILSGLNRPFWIFFLSSEFHELSGSGPILLEVAIQSRSTILKSCDLSRKSGACKVDNLPHSFEVSNYQLLVIFSTASFSLVITEKNASSTVKRSVSRLHIPCRKMVKRCCCLCMYTESGCNCTVILSLWAY